MQIYQVLSCSSSLGNCCTNKGIASLISIMTNIISLIQIIVPIILLVMVAVNLTQLVANPEEKKLVKSIKNKFLAAVFVFMVPVVVNAAISWIPSDTANSFNVLGCIEESKNFKISNKTNYTSTREDTKKTVISDSKDYEPGEERKTTEESSGSSTVTTGEKVTSGEAIIGDSGVKVRKNLYKKKATLTRKLNGQDVVDYAMSWRGKLHYSHGTTDDLRPGGKCDCSQFVYKVLRHFDAIESEAPSVYCSMWSSGNVKGSILYSNLSKLVPGDVVAYYWSDYSQHVEIYAGGNNTIGCDGNGVSVGHRANKYMTFIHLTIYD